MNVWLLNYSLGSEQTVATAGRLCYSPRSTAEIFEGFNGGKAQAQIARLRDAGHFSTFEHTFFCFTVEGISRAATHQLVRHRHLSFEQQSQRYLKVDTTTDWYVVPPNLTQSEESVFHAAMKDVADWYNTLITLGLKPEDARAVLPNAAKTTIMVSGNARAFYEFFTLRTCNNAQHEIRQMAFRMLRQLKSVAPNLFHKAGATCVRGYCNESNGPQCPRYIAVTGRKKAEKDA